MTFTDSDNIRAEAWIDPVSIFRTKYAFYKNGVKYTAENFNTGTYLTGSNSASTVPNFLTNNSVTGDFILNISDYYFQQLEA